MKKNINKKLTIDVIYGGQSPEHEISILSAESIINELINIDEYNIFPLYITSEGKWMRFKHPVKSNCNNLILKDKTNKNEVNPSLCEKNPYYFLSNKRIPLPDIFFPVLHGKNGEDGAIQGLFKLMNKPFVGCDIISSAIGMDKDFAKRIFQSVNIPTIPSLTVFLDDWNKNPKNINKIINKSLNYPLFLKPANGGSSIGVHKVQSKKDLNDAIEKTFKYENKILIEEALNVREIECAVLGNFNPIVSIPGEILPNAEFYDFDDKYSSGMSKSIIPAEISKKQTKTIQEYAIKAYKALNCKGLTRIDFFICKKSLKIFLNEVNTMPGFTKISMYPKLLGYCGIKFQDLLTKLINFSTENTLIAK